MWGNFLPEGPEIVNTAPDHSEENRGPRGCRLVHPQLTVTLRGRSVPRLSPMFFLPWHQLLNLPHVTPEGLAVRMDALREELRCASTLGGEGEHQVMKTHPGGYPVGKQVESGWGCRWRAAGEKEEEEGQGTAPLLPPELDAAWGHWMPRIYHTVLALSYPAKSLQESKKCMSVQPRTDSQPVRGLTQATTALLK